MNRSSYHRSIVLEEGPQIGVDTVSASPTIYDWALRRIQRQLAGRDEIIRRWGEALYRRFRLNLWGSAFAFLNRGMEGYRVLLERPREASAL